MIDQRSQELQINPVDIEFICNKFDSNALNFREKNDYFSIQTSIYLEDDDILDQPYFEYKDQKYGQYGGLQKIIIQEKKITFVFLEDKLLAGKFKNVDVSLNKNIDKKMVGFICNKLFLGRLISHSHNDVELKNIK